MSGNESFLRRWLRRKHESAKAAAVEPEPVESDVPPPLPPLEEVGFDSDFKPFMHPGVARETRNAALKKLFTSTHYQVSDGLDVYVGDYSSPEPLPAAMLAGLVHAGSLLGPQATAEMPETVAPAARQAEPEQRQEDIPEAPAARPEQA